MNKFSVDVLDLSGQIVDSMNLPKVFETPLRPDIIKRAVLAIQSHRYQAQGRDPWAGNKTTAESRGVGLGISRIPRVKGQNRAALAPSTVGGRTTHPPKSEKKIWKKIPKKEMKFALRTAVAATADRIIVTSRGHVVNGVKEFPLVVTDEIQKLKKTRKALDAFSQLGLSSDIYRVKKSRGVRAGKGKRRGRKMKQAVGPLLVITKNEGIIEAARNLPGVDATIINNLNVELLAPGTHPGRFTLWSSSAIGMIDSLFGEN